MNILIAGATGLIGKQLTIELKKRNHNVILINRHMNIDQAPLKQKFENINAIINLAGENISAHRWTESYKKRIYESRVNFTKNLIASLSLEPEIYISASATGIYDKNFLGQVCLDWESAADSLAKSRKVFLRTGVVLSKEGGALKKMLPAFKLGLGIPLGDGQQWMSWIHIDDLVRIYIWALENNQICGAIDAVAPVPITNLEFTKTLAKILNRPSFPVLSQLTKLGLRIGLGEMAEVLLSSQKIIPIYLRDHGFLFKYESLKEALENELGKP